MFCPKCGQEQASESVRFCSRCGAELNTANEGSTGRLFAMAIFLVITLCAIFGWGSITNGPGYIQVRILVAILAAITFYLLYSRDLTGILSRLSSADTEQKRQIGSAVQEPALPPAHSIPVSSFVPHRVDTAEIVSPPSVTEPTTKLLGRDKH